MDTTDTKRLRLIDQRIAEYVFGLEVDYMSEQDAYPCIVVGLGYYDTIPKYSTDIAEAWKVVGRMRELDWFSSVTDLSLDSGTEDWIWHFKLLKNTRNEGVGRGPAPLAICLAALKACGHPDALSGVEVES